MNKSDFVIVYEGNYAGLQTKSGDVVLPCEYDKILDYDDDGYIRFIKDGIYGTIDLQGQVCIPLTANLSHLGVFHKGTARARMDEVWGLVDVHGNHVTDFVYQSINAHRKNGYSAVTLDGKVGLLAEDGSFKVSSKPSKPKSPYAYIATYRNHVAPARTHNGKWVFIDENQKRINDIEYWSMDHVLRNGIYYVAKGPNAYGFADFEGVPLIDEWYEHPYKFDNGFAVCGIKRRDANGKEIIQPSGQPAYCYGVLNSAGKYLFRPVYSSLHWNDYKTKDCWFAEDEDWAYLLFPDGTYKTYAKSEISYDGLSECIPESAFDHDIKNDSPALQTHPRLVTTQYYSLFDEEKFLFRLSPWLGSTMEPLEFYYRDTDADIEVKKLYKIGHFVRTDCDLEVSQKLLRPVHKLRFLIVARRFLKAVQTSGEREEDSLSPFKEYRIPANTHFLVVDVQRCGGITQIVLLHIPHGAMLLAEHFKIRSSKFKPKDCDGMDLKKAAEYDLQQKMSDCVHGHSLDENWCKAMCQPVGCNARLQLNRLHGKPYPYADPSGNSESRALSLLQDCDGEWDEAFFTTIQRHTIKVLTGDLTKRMAEVMIDPVKKGSDCSECFPKCLVNAVKPAILEEWNRALGQAPGSICVTHAYKFPYHKIVHFRLPDEPSTSATARKILKKGLDDVFNEVEKRGMRSVLFPIKAWSDWDEMKTLIEVIMTHLFHEEYTGDIELFAEHDDAAEAYKSYLESIGDNGVIKEYKMK